MPLPGGEDVYVGEVRESGGVGDEPGEADERGGGGGWGGRGFSSGDDGGGRRGCIERETQGIRDQGLHGGRGEGFGPVHPGLGEGGGEGWEGDEGGVRADEEAVAGPALGVWGRGHRGGR